MQVSDIVRAKEIVKEERLIRHIERGLAYFKEHNLLDETRMLSEAAEFVEVDGKFLVDYDSEGSVRSRSPQQIARDVQVFDTRADADRAVRRFNRTGQRTITATAGEAVGKWRQVGGNRGARLNQLRMQYTGRMTRALRWITPLAAIIGAAQTLQTHQEYQQELYLDYHAGFIEEADYNRIVQAQLAAVSTHLVAQFLAHVAVARNVTRVLRIIRTGAMAIGVPAGGPIGAAIGFLVGEAVGWGVVWLLQKRWVAEALIQFFYYTPVVNVLGAVAQNAVNVASDTVGVDLQRAAGLDVQGSENDRAISSPAGPAAPNNRSGSSPAPAGGQGWDAVGAAIGN